VNTETFASLTTAAGTLVLAVATFSATRSANRASRTAEKSLLAALRPVLVHGQIGDPRQKIGYADQHWVHVEGPGAVFEEQDGVLYLAFALHNVGSGIALLAAWHPSPERLLGDRPHAPLEEFRAQTRSLYVPSGGLGFWQGAVRDQSDPLYEPLAKAARNRDPITVDVLYTDINGGQRTVSRLAVFPAQTDHWVASLGRHWVIDEEENGAQRHGGRRDRNSAARR
jgi:hypothetical protein